MGDITVHPCIRCGAVPVRKRVGTMAVLRCRRRPRCGGYVYAVTYPACRALWNKHNPLKTCGLCSGDDPDCQATPQSLTPSGQTDVGTGGTSGREGGR